MRDDELTPSEKEAFATLPKERMPGAGHEDRVARALRERGLLGRRRRVIAVTPARVAGLVAATVAFMVAGFAAGQWTTLRTITSSAHTLNSQELSAAAALQFTASAYLAALDNVAAIPDTTKGDDDARQGREVALKTLYTAAGRVSHMVPRDYLAGQLLDAIDVAVATDSKVGDNTTTPGPKRGLEWF